MMIFEHCKNIAFKLVSVALFFILLPAAGHAAISGRLTISYTLTNKPVGETSAKSVSKDITINSISTLIDADIELLKYMSYGSLATNLTTISATVSGTSYSGFKAVYDAIYQHMLDNASTSWSNTSVTGDNIYKVSGGQMPYFTDGTKLLSGRKVVVSSGPVTLAPPAGQTKFSGGTFIIQGKDSLNRITVDGQNALTVDRSHESFSTTSATNHTTGFWKIENSKTGYMYLAFFTVKQLAVKCRLFESGTPNENMVYVSNSSFEQICMRDGDMWSPLFVYSSTGGCIYVNGCSFINNLISHPAAGGGGLFRNITTSQTSAYIENSVFRDNNEWSTKETTDEHCASCICWKSCQGTREYLWLINCKFLNNYAGGTGGAIMNCTNSVISKCEFTGNKAKGNGGAMTIKPPITGQTFSLTGKGYLNVTLDSETKFENNSSDGLGGGIYAEVSTCWTGSGAREAGYEINIVQNGAVIENNTSKLGGGAIAMKIDNTYKGNAYDYSVGITINSGKLVNNSTDGNGGAIYMGYISGDYSKCSGITVKGGTISGNKAKNGYGGVCYIDLPTDVPTGFKVTGGTLGGTSDADSNSAKSGGGVYVKKGKFEMTGGTISKNAATQDGGGVCVETGSFTMSDGEIINNKARLNGGGVCIKAGEFKITGGKINSNTSEGNGGGLYSLGNCTVSNGQIDGNTATKSGGGIYLSGSGKSITFNGGSVKLNQALEENGGGMAVLGGASFSMSGGGQADSNKALAGNGGAVYSDGGTVTFTKGDITNNSALNGGGIYLINGAQMTFSDGFLSSNKAIAKSSATSLTAYHSIQSSEGLIEGVGGGVYLGTGVDNAHKTSLQLSIPNDTLGIWGNRADKAADDILVDGQYTEVTTLDVTGKKLRKFVGDAVIQWFEDYVEGEKHYNYTDVIRENTSKDTYTIRLRRAIRENNVDKRGLGAGGRTISNQYAALCISYTECDILLKKKGLGVGETSIISLKGPKDVVYNVPMTGTGSGLSQFIKLAPVGTYTVTELPWLWTHTIKTPSPGREIVQSTADDNVFTFESASKDISVPFDEKQETKLLNPQE